MREALRLHIPRKMVWEEAGSTKFDYFSGQALLFVFLMFFFSSGEINHLLQLWLYYSPVMGWRGSRWSHQSIISSLYLHRSKCYQFGSGVGAFIGAEIGTLLCPVMAVFAFITSRGNLPSPFLWEAAYQASFHPGGMQCTNQTRLSSGPICWP